MATIVLQAAGAFAGGLFGSVGAAIGQAAGALAGYAIDRALIASTQSYEGPRLSSARAFSAEEGASLPKLYGTARLGGTLIWATRFEERSQSSRQGAKGGPKVTEYSYHANAAFAVCKGEIAGIRRIWADGEELDQTTVEMRVYRGTPDQMPDPLIEVKQGKDNAPAYRGTAYVVFESLPISAYGNRLPQIQFEVMRPIGRVAADIRAVAMIPGSTEYGLATSLVTRHVRKGQDEAVNRHVLTARTDFEASLDELQALCPKLENVALVVTWFGNDLRAGECQVRPMVADKTGTYSQIWSVDGVTRAEAREVSRHEGAVAYGGTPSDVSVMEAIRAIKARKLKVTLYPFVMMDVAHDNMLPDPYSEGTQNAYPWRGRITCYPAAGRPETADKTAAGRAQVEAFYARDWGYRRMVLHYAQIASAADGVDAFLLGSELRGLSQVRDDEGRFPFVEKLCALAEEVRSVLGPETALTYGADWSEYFGYQPADGSGDLYFHLDPLWAHPAIDAVGIDNYMPLSDWRDEDTETANPDGFSAPYDRKRIQDMIAGGEGYDWYYASDADRLARVRTPITDGAYGKHWVYRYKDLRAWWTNAHYDRIGGIEKAAPTAWQRMSKPFWMTEIGCPAVDKGPNQPNVFPDPKSSEGARPYFSNGGRDDLAMLRYLEAHLGQWSDEERNPHSPVYAGGMVDAGRVFIWAWDSRPFPAFPLAKDIWRDGDNWRLGHWLNGRLSAVALDEVIIAICRDFGLAMPEVAADGTMHGYVLERPSSARAALEPLVQLYGLSTSENGGRLVFRNEGRGTQVDLDALALEGEQPVFQRETQPEHELVRETVLSFHDPLIEYQAASATALRAETQARQQQALNIPIVLEEGQAQVLAQASLERQWSGRETIALATGHDGNLVRAGDVIRLPERTGENRYLVEQVEEGLVRRIAARRIGRVRPLPVRSAIPDTDYGGGQAGGPYGPPEVHFLDLPMWPDAEAAAGQFRIAAWSQPWRGVQLYASPDTQGFVMRASLAKRATLGTVVEATGLGKPGSIDAHGAVHVRLASAALSSVSRMRLLSGANAAALKCRNGAWEVLQFETAYEVEADLWRLSGLLRGQAGTTDAMLSGIEADAAFILLDDAVLPCGLRDGEAGLQLNWRLGPTGHESGGASFSEHTKTGGVRAALPLAPVHLRMHRMATGLAFTWIRCGRIDADRWESEDIPLSESVERYEVELLDAHGTVRRAATVDAPRFLYADTERQGEFPAEETLLLRVRQYSSSAGYGLAAEKTFQP
ncbi:baseplate multidomain protein megatron [Limoniibacter endophyticus]|uniref:Tail protein n=1 Tax=Limoniibacter endophyticus TaxID=1565040 RepID=A0A8J3DN21_9HYPH|nr:glycoside hydrolase/phage tail family protein [Limoniibacter endophyticus]GHC69285.1 hypothetical protein GCM10010136_14950 [Limoniibacter endophyticus]